MHDDPIGDITQGSARTDEGTPFYFSRSFAKRRNTAGSLNPHTLHNAAAATIAQTCDLDFANAKIELCEDEMWEALTEKRLEHAYRAYKRMELFEARANELSVIRLTATIAYDEDWVCGLPPAEIQPGMLIERYGKER